MEKKYKLTEYTVNYNYNKLYRIEALKDFGDVKMGDKGGFIENENNLSQYGDCWVYGDAIICDNALVYGNAKIYDNAIVCGNVKVFGNAKVYDNAVVYGEAMVCDNAMVYEYACIYRNAMVCGNA